MRWPWSRRAMGLPDLAGRGLDGEVRAHPDLDPAGELCRLAAELQAEAGRWGRAAYALGEPTVQLREGLRVPEFLAPRGWE